MMSKYRQFTIRELLLFVLFFGAGLGGLSNGGLFASVVLGVAIFVTTGFAIVAFVAQDELRACAIGFLIPVISYAVTILSVGSSELDPYQGKLPTTKLLQPAHRLIVKTEWINVMTGVSVPDYDPATDVNRGGGGGGFGGTVVFRETPDRNTFMSLAHVLMAMMFGYAGAKFAVFVHHRQSPETETGDEQSHALEAAAGSVSNRQSSPPAQ